MIFRFFFKDFLAILVFCCLFFGNVESKVAKGDVLEKSEGWLYLTKFCFAKGNGTANFEFWSKNPDAGNLLLLFYDDQPDSWSYVYANRHKLSCEEKVKRAKGSPRTIKPGKHQIPELFRDTSSPHFWYFVVANCQDEKLEFSYDIEMLNPGGSWKKQFSFDEQGLAESYTFFWLFFLILFSIHIFGIVTIIRQHGFHPILRLVSIAFITQFFSSFCLFIHFIVYKDNGIGVPGLEGLGEVLDMCSQLVIMFLLILIAKGWCISRTQLTQKNVLIIVMSILLLSYLSVFIWENIGRDPASNLYIYESVPGIILLVLRGITFLWFLYCLRTTHLDEDISEKKTFYLIFGAIFSCWFLTLPFIVFVAALIDAWYRQKVVTILYLCINSVALIILEYLFWPSRANKYFQIDRKVDVLLEGSSSSPYENL